MQPLVVLIGPPGAGKSSVGAALAEALGVQLRDTDADVEARAGMPVSEIFLQQGEQAFRALERAAVADAMASHPGVLSLGGGAPMAEESRQLLAAYRERGGTTVFLDLSLGEAMRRLGMDKSRPLLVGSPRQQWLSLMEARRPTYEALAKRIVLTDGVEAAQIAGMIKEELA